MVFSVVERDALFPLEQEDAADLLRAAENLRGGSSLVSLIIPTDVLPLLSEGVQESRELAQGG